MYDAAVTLIRCSHDSCGRPDLPGEPRRRSALAGACTSASLLLDGRGRYLNAALANPDPCRVGRLEEVVELRRIAAKLTDAHLRDRNNTTNVFHLEGHPFARESNMHAN